MKVEDAIIDLVNDYRKLNINDFEEFNDFLLQCMNKFKSEQIKYIIIKSLEKYREDSI